MSVDMLPPFDYYIITYQLCFVNKNFAGSRICTPEYKNLYAGTYHLVTLDLVGVDVWITVVWRGLDDDSRSSSFFYDRISEKIHKDSNF
jgi:hypothetical protein